MINDRFIRCNFTEIAFLSGKGDKVYGENGTRIRWSNIVVVVRGGKERKEMCDWEKELEVLLQFGSIGKVYFPHNVNF